MTENIIIGIVVVVGFFSIISCVCFAIYKVDVHDSIVELRCAKEYIESLKALLKASRDEYSRTAEEHLHHTEQMSAIIEKMCEPSPTIGIKKQTEGVKK